MKKLLLLLLCLFLGQTASAQVGLFIRPSSASLTSPVSGQTWLFNSTNNTVSVYNGTAFQTISIALNNVATTNPTTANDNTQGYSIGSQWYNSTTGTLYICVSATTGAAVWIQVNTELSIPLSQLQQGGAVLNQLMVWNGSQWGPGNGPFSTPPPIGSVTPNTGAFTTLSTTGELLIGGTTQGFNLAGSSISTLEANNGNSGIYADVNIGSLSINGVSTPTIGSVVPTGTTGSTNYAYVVVAKTAAGENSAASGAYAITDGYTNLGLLNYNAIIWSSIPGAASYDVYRTVSGGTPSSTGKIANVTTTAFNDTGLAGDSTSPPGTNNSGVLSITQAPANSVILGEGGPVNYIIPGPLGYVLTSNGTGVDPSYQAGGGGGIVPPLLQNGRLYLVTASPYADGSSSGNTTLYFGPAPDKGNQITLYNGTSEIQQTFSEISASIATLTSSASSGVFDIYISSVSGTAVQMNAVAWSGNIPPTRDMQDGRYVQHSTPGNLLVGIIDLTTTGKTADWTGQRDISNVYNLIQKPINGSISTSTWTSTSGFGPADSNTTPGQGQIQYVSGLGIGNISIQFSQPVTNSVNSNSSSIGIGLDSTNSPTVDMFTNFGNATYFSAVNCNYTFTPSAGAHYLQALDAVSSGTGTFYGSTLFNFSGTINE